MGRYVAVITAQAAAPAAYPVTAATGGTTYSTASPATVPASSHGLCRSCAYALRETIRHSSASPGYGRTLST
jgi:hypothetical protein